MGMVTAFRASEGITITIPADKTVHMRRLAQFDLADSNLFAGLARQLGLWALAGISDLQARQRAFELARDEQISCRALAS